MRLDGGASTSNDSDFTARYRRDAVSNKALVALEEAGRVDEIIPLCEHEARRTGSYERLVSRLVEAGRIEEAETWIHEGIAAHSERLPGIAASLRKKLVELRTQAGDWPAVAATRAAEFFGSPSRARYDVLLQAAERAGVAEPVRRAALDFLETGKRPDREGHKEWPLPPAPVEEPSPGYRPAFPRTDVLVDIAIHEQRVDDVLRYHRSRPSGGGWLGWSYERLDAVARTLQEAHPEESLEVLLDLTEAAYRHDKL